MGLFRIMFSALALMLVFPLAAGAEEIGIHSQSEKIQVVFDVIGDNRSTRSPFGHIVLSVYAFPQTRVGAHDRSGEWQIANLRMWRQRMSSK